MITPEFLISKFAPSSSFYGGAPTPDSSVTMGDYVTWKQMASVINAEVVKNLNDGGIGNGAGTAEV